MLPMMVYLLGMPTHVAVGTSLFQILFLCAGVTYMQAAANHTVDLILVLPLAASSAVGAQFGARLSRLLRGEQLMILLAVLVLMVTGKMMSGLIMTPSVLLKPSRTGFPQETTQRVQTAAPTHPTLGRKSLSHVEGPLRAQGLCKADRTRRLLPDKQEVTRVAQPMPSVARLKLPARMQLARECIWEPVALSERSLWS